jgi:hypothetical protein
MFRTPIPILLLLSVASTGIVGASEDPGLVELRREVQMLRSEVSRLRAEVNSLNAIRPTVTSLMPEMAERFHVMHYAGDSNDWALASHELESIRHLVDVLQYIDAEKGAMANGFLSPHFNRLEAAIEHGKQAEFDEALNASVDACNACHVAVGSPSMKIGLDAADSLSLRHSHVLVKSKKTGAHTHMH